MRLAIGRLDQGGQEWSVTLEIGSQEQGGPAIGYIGAGADLYVEQRYGCAGSGCRGGSPGLGI